MQHDSYLTAARALLETGGEVLGVEWSLPTDELARMLVALTDGLTYAWLADRDDAAAERLIDNIAATISAFASSREKARQ